MKHILRKPLLPWVLLAVFIFGVCFMTLFQQSILDNQAVVDEMYGSVQLTFQVLPSASANGVLKLRNKTVTKLLAVEGVTDCDYYLECPYSLREPLQLANFSTVYGTNDLMFFAEERGISIDYGVGWNGDNVLAVQEGAIPCLLEANLASVLGVEAGDTFIIAPNADEDVDPQSAPSLTMVAAGTFLNEKGLTDLYSIIVSADTFLSSPGFLYSGGMMESFYYYRTFHFQTDPACNRDFQTIRDAVTSVLKKDGDFILYSNVRILEQAVRPIEQKLRLQQMLVTPLGILLCAAAVVVALLLCSGFSTEVFLRLLWGEKRWLVWLKMMGSLLLLLAMEGAAALAIVWFLSGAQWIRWAAQYVLLTTGLCIIGAAVRQAVFCSKNLVAFYQSKEG